MKRAVPALLLVLPLSALTRPAPPPLAAGVPGASAPGAQDDAAEFQAKFRQAMKINSKDEMRRLMRGNVDHAVAWILSTAEAISVRPSDELYEDMAALRETWNAEFKTDFVDKMERYFSLLEGPTKRDRQTAKAAFDKQVNNFWAAIKAEKPEAFGPVALEFEGLAKAFHTLGDVYYESQCYLFLGQCWDEHYRKGDADLDKAAKAYGKVLETRDDLGLKDRYYKETRERHTALVGLGFGAPEQPAGGAGAAPEVGQPGAPVTAELDFQLVMPDDVQRPNYFLDDLYQIWHSVSLADTGSTTQIVRLEGGPLAVRDGAAKIGVDVDGDGKGDVEIPLRGSPQPVEFEIGDGDAKRKWAFVARVGIQEDNYQGIQSNLAPQDDRIGIYVAPAGSLVGEIGGVSVQVIDENMNGVYGDVPQSWGHLGLTEGQFQPELDSIVVDGEKQARPWSEYQKIGDQWYQIAVELGGKRLVATPTPVATGTLSLKSKGAKFECLVVRGTGKYENSFFDLTTDKEVEVPIGRWELHYGFLGKGKKAQRMKALVLPGDRTRWDVTSDAEVEVELGAPYDLDFDVQVDGDQLTVIGSSIAVLGAGSERYERLYNCVLRPEVSWRKAGSKRGSKGEKMDVIGGSDEIIKYGWEAAWFPLDLTIDLKGEDEAVEVQLVDKKNKLFGKLESSWRD